MAQETGINGNGCYSVQNSLLIAMFCVFFWKDVPYNKGHCPNAWVPKEAKLIRRLLMNLIGDTPGYPTHYFNCKTTNDTLWNCFVMISHSVSPSGSRTSCFFIVCLFIFLLLGGKKPNILKIFTNQYKTNSSMWPLEITGQVRLAGRRAPSLCTERMG